MDTKTLYSKLTKEEALKYSRARLFFFVFLIVAILLTRTVILFIVFLVLALIWYRKMDRLADIAQSRLSAPAAPAKKIAKSRKKKK